MLKINLEPRAGWVVFYLKACLHYCESGGGCSVCVSSLGIVICTRTLATTEKRYDFDIFFLVDLCAQKFFFAWLCAQIGNTVVAVQGYVNHGS